MVSSRLPTPPHVRRRRMCPRHRTPQTTACRARREPARPGRRLPGGASNMSAQRALLLVNVKARQGDAAFPQAIDLLRRRGLALIDAPVEGPEAFPAAIRRHAGEADLIILGGGDGAMNLSVEAVLESGRPLGILPVGTANDLARTLGIPAALEEACAVVADGWTRRIDLGRVNGKHFFNVASMGLSVEIARCMTRQAKRRWGILSYCITAAQGYRASR